MANPGHPAPATGAGWHAAAAAPVPAAPERGPMLAGGPGWRPVPRRRTPVLVLEVFGIALGLAGLVWVLSLVLAEGGASATAVAGGLAFIPLLVVLLVVRWVDRWEPEPRWVLLTALVWGVGVSTAVALIFNELITASVYVSTGDATVASVVSSVVGAPLVEESAKGLGVLLIFLLHRRSFDGPVDGIVYAGVVAAGFAFTENILYFVQYQETLPQVFLSRAIIGPFAHVTFTACIGIALGYASRAGRWSWLYLAPLGWFGAVILHAVWNASAALSLYGVLYWVFEIPLFAAGIVLVLWLRNDERATIGHRLTEYAQAGWFAPYEVTMLTSLAGRRAARRWADAGGPDAAAAMREFQSAASALAYARQRSLSGRDPRARQDEAELLERVARAREEFTSRVGRSH